MSVTFKHQSRGFVTSVAVVVSLAILVFFSSIYYFLDTTSRQNIVIEMKDQSSTVSEAAVQDVINILRINPNVVDLDKNMRNPADESDLLNANLDGGAGASDPAADGLADGNDFYTIYTPNYPKLLLDRNNDDKVIGRYTAKVKAIDVNTGLWDNLNMRIFRDELSNAPVQGKVFHIVTEGKAISPRGQVQSPATTHSFVYLPNVGEYFCAVKGYLGIAAGTQLPTAKVYGRELDFDISAGVPNSIVVQAAHYQSGYLPISDEWQAPTDADYRGYQPVKINEGRDNEILEDVSPAGPGPEDYFRPMQLNSPLVFPGIQEQLGFYQHTIPGPDDAPTPDRWADVWNCNFQTSPLQPPSIMSNGTVPATNNNRDHAYYCDNQEVTIGNVVVEGQVIIASRLAVRITGNITIANPGSPRASSKCPGPECYIPPDLTGTGDMRDFPDGVPSKADQLIIYAGGGVIIDQNWCNNVPTPNHLALQGVLIISPDSSIGYEEGPCATYPSYSLDFLGAMVLAEAPELGSFFRDPGAPGAGRHYRYLETLRTDPPPIREYYQILRQFTVRRGSNPS